jgi:ankyrin repeat protein
MQQQQSSSSQNAITVRACGVVGNYKTLLLEASKQLKLNVVTQRTLKFSSLDRTQQAILSSQWLEICTNGTSDDARECLASGIDVNGFYRDSINNIDEDEDDETFLQCALHVAASSGNVQVLQFLLDGIDEDSIADSSLLDGGCCEMDVIDVNGWTAAHFAVAANDGEKIIKILSSAGSNMTVEAASGYSPYDLSERLRLTEVTKLLKSLGHSTRFRYLALGIPPEVTELANRIYEMAT